MSIALKLVVACGLVLATMIASATALVGGALVSGGVARVAIHAADGPDLELAIPGAVLTAAAFAGSRLTAGHGHPLALETGEHGLAMGTVGETARDMLRHLESMPDATLVEIVDGADLVRISKRGRRLEVRVVDGHDDVNIVVSLPIRSARTVVSLLTG